MRAVVIDGHLRDPGWKAHRWLVHYAATARALDHVAAARVSYATTSSQKLKSDASCMRLRREGQ